MAPGDAEQLLAALEDCGLIRGDMEDIRPGWVWLERYLGGEAPESGGEGSLRLRGLWGCKAILGVTGNIAVGKSTVLGMLESLGAEVIDADRVVHELRAPGRAGYEAVVALLGTEIVLEDGRLNTQELARRAFRQPELLRELETVFAPLAGEEIAYRARQSAQRVVAVEAIRLLEGELRQAVDQVWVVDAPRQQQIERLVMQRGLTLAEAQARIDAQNPQAQKLAQADIVIHNLGTPAETRRQVLSAWATVLAALYEMGWLPHELVEQWVALWMAEQGGGWSASRAMEALQLIAHYRQRGRVTRQAAVDLLAKEA